MGKDLFANVDRHISTFSGRLFYLDHEDTGGIDLHDICHALSNICRFTGHTKRFYSVAEHSILVANILSKVTLDPDVILQGLMHDSTEAYLADVSSPFKGALKGYKKIEKRTWKRIAKAFMINPKMDPMVKDADWIAVFAEALTLQPKAKVENWTNFEMFRQQAYAQLGEEGIPDMAPSEAEDKLFRMVCHYMMASQAKRKMLDNMTLASAGTA